MNNPVFDIWNKTCGPIYDDHKRFDMLLDGTGQKDYEAMAQRSLKGHTARNYCIKNFCWAVPGPEAIEKLNSYSKIIEICAGSGYWASLLNTEIKCFDTEPWSKLHYPVKVGSYEQIKKHKDHTLFLCWPPYESDIVTKCLDVYEGDTILYVGEWSGGCTAWDDRLDTDWEEEQIAIPQWQYIHDSLIIFERK